MPVSRVKPQKLYDSLEKKSSDYAKKATQISKILEDAEVFLQDLPGKVEVEVEGSGIILAFSRAASNWRLMVYLDGDGVNSSEDRPLSDCGIVEKANAAILLPQLVSKLISIQDERLKLLDTALKELKSSPLLREIIKKEEA